MRLGLGESQTSSDAELKPFATGALYQSGAVCRYVVAVACGVDVDTKRCTCQPGIALCTNNVKEANDQKVRPKAQDEAEKDDTIRSEDPTRTRLE